MDDFFQSLLNDLLKLLFKELTDTHLLLQFGNLLDLCLSFGLISELVHMDQRLRLLLFAFPFLLQIQSSFDFGFRLLILWFLLLYFLLFWLLLLVLFGKCFDLFIFSIGLLLSFHKLNYQQSAMNQTEMEEIYKMVDNIPFSRPKKNINRDFSDAVMLAELIYFYNPKIVSLHNYPPANSTPKKIQNWSTLNLKVLKKLNLGISKQQIDQISNCVPGVIEQLLYQVFLYFQKPEQEGKLVKNARMMDSKLSRFNEEEGEPGNKQNLPFARKTAANISSQTEEIIRLVQQIDQATEKLNQVREASKTKDQIIANLEKKLEKVIFG